VGPHCSAGRCVRSVLSAEAMLVRIATEPAALLGKSDPDVPADADKFRPGRRPLNGVADLSLAGRRRLDLTPKFSILRLTLEPFEHPPTNVDRGVPKAGSAGHSSYVVERPLSTHTLWFPNPLIERGDGN
jgi:hypothetical protein